MNGTTVNSHVNGKFKYDPDDEDFQRELRQPAEIKEDLNQMSHRARVGQVLKTPEFKNQLNQVVGNQLNLPNTSITALKQISSLLLPKLSSPLITVNDLHGVEFNGMPQNEKVARCKLASLCRLIDLLGWTHSIYNHITLRLSSDMEHFLVNPFGLLYNEVTASSLVKLDMQGNIIEGGSTELGINKAGYLLHSAIHSARPDIKCVIHVHTAPIVAVSAMKHGLLPLSHESLLIGEVGYHDYTGILTANEQIDKIAHDLGPNSKVLFLRNHGLAACGETVEEAFFYAHNAFTACNIQTQVSHLGVDNLSLADDEAKQAVLSSKPRYLLEFSAYMRQMDNAGFRTGFPYPQQLRMTRSVEITTTTDDYEPRCGYKRHEWIYHTPNTYLKVDTGDGDRKWMVESEPCSPRRVLSDTGNYNRFAPQGQNPREFKETQKKIKKEYYEDKIHAGPQSKILEGRTWEEAEEARMQQTVGQPDQVVVIGAASKGIIKRGAEKEEKQTFKEWHSYIDQEWTYRDLTKTLF